MKGITWVFVITLIFFYACSNSGNDIGTPKIDREKMAQISADLHIIESHLQNSPAKQRDSIRSTLYYQLYKIHEVDSTELFENQQIYYQKPKEVEKMYGRVLEILGEKEEKLDL